MLTFSHQFGPGAFMSLKFSGKPCEEVRAVLKSWGCRWNPQSGTWWRGKVSGGADLCAAVQKTIDRVHGVRRPDGGCWVCKSPEGFFRNRGAAAPVWCDVCNSRIADCEAYSDTLRGPARIYSQAYAGWKLKGADMSAQVNPPSELSAEDSYSVRDAIDSIFYVPSVKPAAAPFIPDRFDLDVEDSMARACGL